MNGGVIRPIDAYSGHRDHADRSIVISQIGRRDRRHHRKVAARCWFRATPAHAPTGGDGARLLGAGALVENHPSEARLQSCEFRYRASCVLVDSRRDRPTAIFAEDEVAVELGQQDPPKTLPAPNRSGADGAPRPSATRGDGSLTEAF